MAAKLGGTFLVGAGGPVNYAGQCILSSRVTDGLRELTPDSLYGGFRRGVEESAKRVGVGPADVESLLPMDKVKHLVSRLTLSQQRAVEAWNLHAGHIGGLLKGVADLTADGRAPDVGLCLDRLAKKVMRDRELADPLAPSRSTSASGKTSSPSAATSSTTAAPSSAPTACAASAASSPSPASRGSRRGPRRRPLGPRRARAPRRDPRRRQSLRRARRSIRATPAAPRRISAAPRRADGRVRRAARARGERAGNRPRHARRKRARSSASRKSWSRSATRSRPTSTPARSPRKTPRSRGARAPLLRRIAQGALDSADFGPSDADLPCAGTPAAARLDAAFTRAVLASPARWANADDPSKLVTATLVAHVAELPSSAKQVVARRADDLAKKALIVGVPGLLPRAIRLCQLKDALGIHGGSFCAGALFTLTK